MIKNKEENTKTPKFGETSKKFVGKYFVQMEMYLEIHDCDISYINGLRGVLCSEIPAKILTCEMPDINTTDKAINLFLLIMRIRQLCIGQNVNPDTIVKISKTNHTNKIIQITTDDIKVVKGKITLEDHVIICDLNPGKTLEINNIYIEEGTSMDNGCFKITAGIPVVKSLNVEMYNRYTKTGVKSSEVDPRDNSLTFSTNGNITPQEVLDTAFKILISKLETLNDRSTFLGDGGDYDIIMDGENWAIPTMLKNELVNNFPYDEVMYASIGEVYGVENKKYKLSLMLDENKYSDISSVRKLFDDVQKRCLKTLKKLKEQ